MSFPIVIEVRHNPGQGDFALCLVSGEHVLELQSGFVSELEAMQALVECLTYAPPPPPDFSHLEAAAGELGQIKDDVQSLNEAMNLVGERLDVLESGRAPAAAPAARVAAPVMPPPPAERQRPTIRRGIPELSPADTKNNRFAGGATRGRYQD